LRRASRGNSPLAPQRLGLARASTLSSVVAVGWFDVLPSEIELEIVRVIDTPAATPTSVAASVAEPAVRIHPK
jgi:hypothetical protein